MIETWSQGNVGENMPEDILVALGESVRQHPWWRARARLTLGLLGDLGIKPPRRVLDAGCGWGSTLMALECAGYQVAGADVSRQTLERLDAPSRRLFEADLTKELPADVPKFDAVLALDVIEHLDDDRAAVGVLGKAVVPGGVLVVSVPALPELFTEFDEIQGHRRRYLPETLKFAFEGSGLAVERLFWWGEWLVPLLRRQRKAKRSRPGDSTAESYRRYLKLPPWPAPVFMKLGFAFEQGRAIQGKLKTGTSLFAVARREGSL